MAAPTVAGAVALYKSSRPKATPAEVREALRYLGNLNWKTSTDPDFDPRAAARRVEDRQSRDLRPEPGRRDRHRRSGPAGDGARDHRPQLDLLRAGQAVDHVAALGLDAATWPPPACIGWTAKSAAISIAVPMGTPVGSYQIGVQGTNQGRTVTVNLPVNVVVDIPTAKPPVTSLISGRDRWVGARSKVRVSLAGGHRSVQRDRRLRGRAEHEWRRLDLHGLDDRPVQPWPIYTLEFDTVYRFRVRAVDAAGHWSPWVEAVGTSRIHPFDDRSPSVTRSPSWRGTSSTGAYQTTLSGIDQDRREGQPELHRPRASPWSRLARRTSARSGSTSMACTSRTVSLKTATREQSAGRLRVVLPERRSHRITLRVVGTGTYPLVRLDAIVVSRSAPRKPPACAGALW